MRLQIRGRLRALQGKEMKNSWQKRMSEIGGRQQLPVNLGALPRQTLTPITRCIWSTVTGVRIASRERASVTSTGKVQQMRSHWGTQ